MARCPSRRSARVKENGRRSAVLAIARIPYFSASFFIASRMALFGSSSAVDPDWPGAARRVVAVLIVAARDVDLDLVEINRTVLVETGGDHLREGDDQGDHDHLDDDERHGTQ